MSQSVQDIYKMIPDIKCKGLCQDSCGPILMSEAEQNVLLQVYPGIKIPNALEMLERHSVDPSDTMDCPLLTSDGKCSIYEHRPAICRIWGVVKDMQCEHGCVPDVWLEKNGSHFILDLLDNQ